MTIVWNGSRATGPYLLVDEAQPRDEQPAPIRLRSIRDMLPSERAGMVTAATAPEASVSHVAAQYGVTYAALKRFVARRLRE